LGAEKISASDEASLSSSLLDVASNDDRDPGERERAEGHDSPGCMRRCGSPGSEGAKSSATTLEATAWLAACCSGLK
jgi:hypothetical protein